MLVLSRKIDEQFVITTPDYKTIRVTLVDIRGDKARIGIEAPQGYAIHRAEVQEAILRSGGNVFGKAEAHSPRTADEGASAQITDDDQG